MSLLVIKYGGHAMDNAANAVLFAQSVKKLRDKGHIVVLGHGGGPHINAMLKRLNIESHFVNGMRYTSPEVMTVVEMVLRGNLSSWLVSLFLEAGIPTVGISGKDNSSIKAKKIEELGLVGEVKEVDTNLVRTLLLSGFMPVISPIGYGEKGESLNINADTATGAIAGGLKADAFVLLTDVAGVLDKNKQLLPVLTQEETETLKADKTIIGGMIPKVDSCLYALEKGCKNAFILDGRVTNGLESLFLENKPIGTRITHKEFLC